MLAGLAGEAIHDVDIEIGYAFLAQDSDGCLDFLCALHPVDPLLNGAVENLYAQARAVETAIHECGNDVGRHTSRIKFRCDLSMRAYPEKRSKGFKKSIYLG